MKFRLFVLAGAVALMAVGVIRLRNASADVLPEFAPPYVEVQTEALGLSASEVESLVSVNLEELLNGTPWLDSIRSTSVPGLSSVVLTFKAGTDVLRARQLVAERLTLAYALPNVSSPPVILQPLSATSRVMMVSLSSKQVSAIQMSVLARWTVRPALLAVPGVANVSIWGFRDRQLQVQVDPRRLARDKVSLDQIVRTAGNAMWVSPLTYLEASTPGAGGWIDTPQQRLEVRHVFPINSPSGLATVRVEDHPQQLGSVASVVEGHQPLIGDAVLKDGPGLLLVVEKFPGADTLDVTRGVEKTLKDLDRGLTGITTDTNVFRPASYITSSTHHLTTMLWISAVLGLLAVLAVLYSWRAALISAVAIAVSLAVAVLVVLAFGATINAMVVAGLVIALIVIVDEAIVGVENVTRRLREHRATGGETSTAKVILDGTLEVNRLALCTTLIVILPLLPVLFITGVTGRLFAPVALAYVLAVLASVVVALTVTPALGSILLAKGGAKTHESPVGRWLQRVYAVAIDRVLRAPGPAFAVAAVAIAVAAVLAPFIGRTQLPEFKDQSLVIRWDGPPGTSAPEMTRITARLGSELQSVPGVGDVAGQVGRAVLGDQVRDVNSGEVYVKLDPGADHRSTLAAVRNVVNGYPGLTADVQTVEQRSLRRAQTGTNDPVVVNIFGPRLDILQSKGNEVLRALVGIPGVRRLNVEPSADQPHVEITVNLANAQRYGLKPGDVRREAATLLAGLTVGSLFDQQKVFQVAVWSKPDQRHSLTDIKALLLDTPSAGRVPLGKVAEVAIKPSPAVIRREAVSRRVQIGLSLDGRDAGSVMRDVQSRLARVAFPLEYHAEVRGEASEAQQSRHLMIGAGIVAAVVIFLLLQAAFGSWLLAALVFLALPFALVGGVLAASLAGDAVSLGSLLAFLALLALAARNAVLLIDRYRQLQREGVPLDRALVIRGTSERLLPIVTTALAIALALVPLLVTGAVAGQEIAQPIAVIVLGGLFTTTALSLFLIPVLYLHFGSRSAVLENPDLQLQ